MNTKFLIIAGAGCTLSDASRAPASKKPPLDKGFFKAIWNAGYPELASVKKYIQKIYSYDPTEPSRDSMESVMAMFYADIHNPELEKDAVGAFRALIKIFNKRIAETTNNLPPTNRSYLYRIICQALECGVSPEEICIITYNQDIQIEKVLSKIQGTKRAKKYGRIFNFPYCYGIPGADQKISQPKGAVEVFNMEDESGSGLELLKLHGSLNWFSTHNTRKVPKNSILSSSKKFRITPRARLIQDLTFTTNKRTFYTFPLIIPPVTHKAGILHDDIRPLWSKAERALKSARKIVVFGYSCPPLDFESANLIRRTVHQNEDIEEFNVIDPNPQVFQRYVELTGLDRLHYYRSAMAYLEARQ